MYSHDKHRSAAFLAGVLGLPVGASMGHFVPVVIDGVTFDFDDHDGPFTPQHYAFLVSDDVFDHGFARICDDGIEYWADPGLQRPGEINRRGGGRGVYFRGPDGHLMELLTVA
ncbi:MAG TPA: VOC family protein [Acidimicrobiia bacterium]